MGSNGTLYIVDSENRRIRQVKQPLVISGETIIPSDDGGEAYVFNNSGRHLRTVNALTGAVRYQFGYDSNGYLTTVTDGDGNITTIERD